MRNQAPRRTRPPANRQNASARHRQGSAGNASRTYERYMAMAREAALKGDVIETENCYQHAEHYFRMMREHEKDRK